MRARVLIRPKEGILDPQGKAVERALPALGFGGVSKVRVGRLVELEAESADPLPDLCEKLLANPLIEDFEIEVLDEERDGSRAADGARRSPPPREGGPGDPGGGGRDPGGGGGR